jgi:hypothetical protein
VNDLARHSNSSGIEDVPFRVGWLLQRKLLSNRF